MPDGRRRVDLEAALVTRVLPHFAGRVQPFDEAAAFSLARLHRTARTAGYSLGLAESCIAAIFASWGFAVATRHLAAFMVAGVDLIDPWSD